MESLDFCKTHATKLFSPQMELHSNLIFACSLSSMDMNITPLSDISRFAILSRLLIKESHLL